MDDELLSVHYSNYFLGWNVGIQAPGAWSCLIKTTPTSTARQNATHLDTQSHRVSVKHIFFQTWSDDTLSDQSVSTCSGNGPEVCCSPLGSCDITGRTLSVVSAPTPQGSPPLPVSLHPASLPSSPWPRRLSQVVLIFILASHTMQHKTRLTKDHQGPCVSCLLVIGVLFCLIHISFSLN